MVISAVTVYACSSTCVAALDLPPNFNAPLSPSSPPPINAHSTLHIFKNFLLWIFQTQFLIISSSIFLFKQTIIPLKMLICCPVMKRWFSTTVYSVCGELICSQSGLVVGMLKKFAVALLTCIFALGLVFVAIFTVHSFFFLLGFAFFLRTRTLVGRFLGAKAQYACVPPA